MDPTWNTQSSSDDAATTPPPGHQVTGSTKSLDPAEDPALAQARALLGQQPTHGALGGAGNDSSTSIANGELKPLPELPTSDQVTKLPSDLSQPSPSPEATQVTEVTKSLPVTPAPPSPVHLPRQETATALPEATSHLPGYAVALGGVVALLVLAGGMFFATEAGWLSLGVEQLWGLSNRPDAALTKASTALASTQNYQMEGELTLNPSEGTSTGPSSVQFRTQHAGPVTQLDARWIVGATSTVLGPRLTSGGSLQTSSIASGTDLYIRHDGMMPDAPWIQATTTELTNFSLAPLDWSALLAALAGGSDGKRLPGKTINGVRTKGYEVTVPSGQLLSLLSPPLARLGDPVTAQVWLGTKDARPYLIQFNGSLGLLGTLSGQLVPAAYDELVPIALPAPDQVEAGSLNDWLEREGIVAVATPSSRDTQRRADLDRIAQALGEYFVTATPPTYPVTAGVVRLDQDVAIPQALKPYLDSVPADPQAPERYYGYESDGTTFRLTAVAEELAPDVQESNGLKLMIRTSQ